MAIVLLFLQITGSGFTATTPAVVRGAGGPDAYGYRWVDSDTSSPTLPVPTYNWIDISTVGTQVTGLGDDNVVGPFSIGFDFPYYWYTVNSFFVGSNGYIAFGDNFLEAAPFPTIPSTARPNNVLAPFMSDLDFSVGSPVCYYWTNAAQDTFIIAYHDVRFWNSPASLNTFEIILSRADSSILFQYETQQGVPSGGYVDGLTVGIENIAGDVGLQYNHDQLPTYNAIHDSLAILFYPPDSTSYEVHDIGIMKIMNDVSGGFFLYNGDTVDCWALVKNMGNQTETGVNVYCQIRNAANTLVFADTMAISSIDPGDTDSLVFTPGWSTTTDGLYRMKIKSLLGDMVPNNDSIMLEFRVVTYPVELMYDIGFAHTGFAWNGVNSGYGMRFVPPVYPTKINMARFNVNSVTGTPIVTVQILDDDGPGGIPGTILYETPQPVAVAQWYDIDVSAQNIEITDGAFYIGCITNTASAPYFGMDTLPLAGRQTWEYTGVWAPYRENETHDVLIRAMVDFATGIEEYELRPGENTTAIIALPNPFTIRTAINVPPFHSEVDIYDAAGRRVRTLAVENGVAYWQGDNDANQKLSQGVYFGVVGDTMVKIIMLK
ncbi:MAG: hypothetical protein JSV98_01130 [candidate division WOR-3 bacterium]|nr:MAG: hypothetical protein JSV98_01130 [candidate division WOR-3 bacterium]